MENNHRNSGFSHEKRWIFPLQTVSSPEGTATIGWKHPHPKFYPLTLAIKQCHSITCIYRWNKCHQTMTLHSFLDWSGFSRFWPVPLLTRFGMSKNKHVSMQESFWRTPGRSLWTAWAPKKGGHPSGHMWCHENHSVPQVETTNSHLALKKC